jgi:DnaJ family protein C protein 17
MPDFVNFYALLGVAQDADEAAIRRAYRRKALELHPDKNPDNPKAEELFMAIKHASEALLEPGTRAVLDGKLAAVQASAARFRAMDDTRAVMREQLERRESASAAARSSDAASAAELDRLRRAGREATAAASAALHSQRSAAAAEGAAGSATSSRPAGDAALDFDLAAAVRVKWDADVAFRLGGTEGGAAGSLSERQLRSLFKLYGPIALILGRKGRAAAIVFETVEGAEAAVAVPPDGFRVTRLAGPEEEDAAPGQEAGGRKGGQKRGREEGGDAAGVPPAAPPPVRYPFMDAIPTTRELLAKEAAALEGVRRLARRKPDV